MKYQITIDGQVVEEGPYDREEALKQSQHIKALFYSVSKKGEEIPKVRLKEINESDTANPATGRG